MRVEGKRCDRCPVGVDCPFCALGGDARSEFESVVETRSYAAGARLVVQGERPDGLFIVRQGLVRLRHDGDDGRTTYLGLVGGAGLLGVSESINGSRSAVSAVAAQPTTVEVVPRADLVPLLLRHPATVVPLLVWESAELERRTGELLDERASRPLPDRLLQRLRDLADVCGEEVADGVLIDVPLSVRNVGDTLGCSRQWASKLLGDAEAAGLVKRRHRRILLTEAALRSAGTSAARFTDPS